VAGLLFEALGVKIGVVEETMAIGLLERAKAEGWTDAEVIARVKGGETALYEILMRRYNQRLFRAARAILKDDAEAEDVMQEAYVKAFQNLHQFEGRAPFSAWLLRIAVNEALGRRRGRERTMPLEEESENGEFSMSIVETSPDPEQNASRAELGYLLERAVLALPEAYRVVVMLRDVEEMSTAETAAALELSEENVKIRLHRGHAMMREMLFEQVGAEGKKAFPFMGERCDRVVAGVFEKLRTRVAEN
jgi:RNA polymerase sigma-70 factor (ECF subfamily)